MFTQRADVYIYVYSVFTCVFTLQALCRHCVVLFFYARIIVYITIWDVSLCGICLFCACLYIVFTFCAQCFHCIVCLYIVFCRQIISIYSVYINANNCCHCIMCFIVWDLFFLRALSFCLQLFIVFIIYCFSIKLLLSIVHNVLRDNSPFHQRAL